MRRLHAALGSYPHTRPLMDGRVTSDKLSLEFANIPTANRAFAPMVREGRYDVSEMAIATFLQAKAVGKPLVLLPVVLAARYQEGALLCRADSAITEPCDLRGRRIGARAYSQTTAMWMRAILRDFFSIEADEMDWTVFEAAHVAEIADPTFVRSAPAGADMLAMLRARELDAVIVGNDVPDDPGLRTVFADPAAAAERFHARHGMAPLNHLLCVSAAVAADRPVVAELLRMFAAARALAERQLPFGMDAVREGVALALRAAAAQSMLPRPLTEDDVWAGCDLTEETWI